MEWGLLAAGGAIGAVGAWVVLRRRHRHRTAHLEDAAERLRDQLQRAQAMEALGILAGSIVHNLNNLLTAILGHGRLAADDLDPRHPVQRHLEQILRAADSAGALTREILEFEGRAEQERQPQRLQTVVRETVKLLRDLLPETVELRTDLDPACGPVLASTPQVQQLLMSLVSNSYHAMPRRRGVVSVTLEQASLGEARPAVPQPLAPGDYVRLGVRDDGSGMDEATLARVFEPYFSGREPRRGAGLGMTTVKRIVAAHDGGAIPQSQPGRGTRIDVYFPVVAREVPSLAEPAADRAAPAVGRGPSARGAGSPATRVLLVDDEALVANMLKTGLERLGYLVTVRPGGPQGLAAFVEAPDGFDVVVSDQIMRGLTGVRLAREIHALRPDLPVLLVTGFRDSVEDDRARAAGIGEVLEKPLSHHDLAAAIERALAASARAREEHA